MTSDSRRLVIFGASNMVSDLFDCASVIPRIPGEKFEEFRCEAGAS